jgi:hypothetical protein
MLELTVSLLAVLVVFSVFNMLDKTYLRRYGLLLHSFSSPFFLLGVCYQSTEEDSFPVERLRIGLIFVMIEISAFKFTEEIAEEFPDFRPELFSWSQKLRSFF